MTLRPAPKPPPVTHEPEKDVEPAVAGWFEVAYGADAVERQAYLPDVRWFCDVVVECGWCTLYVEVENDSASVRPGAAQAAAYAGTDPAGVPAVVVPEGHTDGARVEAVRRGTGVLVREFDAAEGRFV